MERGMVNVWGLGPIRTEKYMVHISGLFRIYKLKTLILVKVDNTKMWIKLRDRNSKTKITKWFGWGLKWNMSNFFEIQSEVTEYWKCQAEESSDESMVI